MGPPLNRQISVPPDYIKLWQWEVLPLITYLYEPKISAHGFVAGKSIKTNALQHVNRQIILNLDLQDFFPSIHFGRVLGTFQKSPFYFQYDVAVILARLCTNSGYLPQGAPTSPILSNFICRRLDNDLHHLTRKLGCYYSRYADDITISTKKSQLPESILKVFSMRNDEIELGRKLVEIISMHDFKIHKTKIRAATREDRQEVTGLIVNKKVNVQKKYIRQLRAKLHNWEKNGLSYAEKRIQSFDLTYKSRSSSPPKLIRHIAGKLEYLRMIRGSGDALYTRYAIKSKRLGGKPNLVRVHKQATKILPFLAEAMWILVGFDSGGDEIAQGTAFYLDSVGFVSAAHVFCDPPCPVKDWYLVRGALPWDKFKVTSYKHNLLFDLAILETSAKPNGAFLVTKSKLETGEIATIVGYPNWHSTADELLRVLTS